MPTRATQVMSQTIKTVNSGEPMEKATQIMADYNIRHIPVLDENNEIIGIISSRDIPIDPEYANLPVDLFMNAPVVFIDATASLKQAMDRMLADKISSLLVVDETDEVVGIITTHDLLSYFAKQFEGQSKSKSKNVIDVQTIGQIANQLSLVGI